MSALPHEASYGRGERYGFRMDKCVRAIAQAIFIPILGVDLSAGINSSPFCTELVELGSHSSPTDWLHIPAFVPPSVRQR